MPDPSRSVSIDFDPFFVEPTAIVSPHAPRALTRNILLDSRGNLWFATWQGLIRFDGEVFTNYTLKHDLRRFRVFSLLEDRKGNLWFGTIGGGVYRYDGQIFTNFTEMHGLVGDRVGSIFEDTSGILWFATDEGVSRYDGERFTNFTAEDGLSDDEIIDVAQDGRGDLWFGTRGGLNRFDGRTFTEVANPEGESFRNVRSLMVDRVGIFGLEARTGSLGMTASRSPGSRLSSRGTFSKIDRGLSG
jgi:ligand-binding sensor domain-containing protein